MASSEQSAILSPLQIEAHLETLEARAVELEAMIESGHATADHRRELSRVQAEVEFLSGLLDDMGHFNPDVEEFESQRQAASTSCS
jgi:uncharacterized coiled-coil protein SlyX